MDKAPANDERVLPASLPSLNRLRGDATLVCAVARSLVASLKR